MKLNKSQLKKLKGALISSVDAHMGIDRTTVGSVMKRLEPVIVEELMLERERILGQFYDFARSRYQQEEDFWSNKPSEKWKNAGKKTVLSELLRFCKDLNSLSKEDE